MRNYSRIHMVGISGGGWTTTLYAALDPRISYSYPIAGTRPVYLDGALGGDYEQSNPDMLKTASYLELYILGAYGDGRRQLQLLNQFDPCCAWGIAYKTYENTVKKRIEQLGQGRFEVYLDSTHRRHIISEHAIDIILKDLKN